MTDAPNNPYRTLHARMSPPGAAWDEGFAAGRAALPDPTVLAPGTWIAPDGSPQDAAEIEAYVRRAAALPDERLREALELIRAHARLDLTERGIAEAERYAAIADDALTARDQETER